ncbi:hypothetical protein HPB48_020368 [Haemaphysalis longicornis]|uniref:DDE Tnp4 domain-containing protein n=1 Tax=Haemaphysalis longicornis TaxID=44386 RepID=A0A9J6H1J4_HAELO|nr:hypothetical protein HPB48_020368 [Haemaphysalis longicornis]
MARSKMAFLAKSSGKGPRNTVGCIDVLAHRDPEARRVHCLVYQPEEVAVNYSAGSLQRPEQVLDVFIGFPGSAHDARVLRESPFFEEAAAQCGDGYILGDSAYPMLLWLLPPYKDNGSSFFSWKKRFNKYHSQQRVAIENCFGLLKQRFRRLYLVDAKTIMQVLSHCYGSMRAAQLVQL